MCTILSITTFVLQTRKISLGILRALHVYHSHNTGFSMKLVSSDAPQSDIITGPMDREKARRFRDFLKKVRKKIT